MIKTDSGLALMTFKLNRNNLSFWKLILLGVIIPFFVLPFIHYHPETEHSHSEGADVHQHQGRYHYTTLEAYAHLVNGHFSDHDLDDRFHHSNIPEEQDEDDSGFFILAKNSKSFKQGLTFNQFGHASLILIPNTRVAASTGSEPIFFKSRTSESPHSSRSPPHVIL